MAPDVIGQFDANRVVNSDLTHLLDPEFLKVKGASFLEEADKLKFVQSDFFLILFRSIFRSLGIDERRLSFYSELNYCIKGTITAADNLFDDEEKLLLPLSLHGGQKFTSIMQLMAFERLTLRTCVRAMGDDIMRPDDATSIQRSLFSQMATIGTLEGVEEKGVSEIPKPEDMLNSVHSLRGGSLFALAFVAPNRLETKELEPALREAERAIIDLGVAFQIVDDIVDFEDDVTRRSNNLLVSQIHHCGSVVEKDHLAKLSFGQVNPTEELNAKFQKHAERVHEMAVQYAREACLRLHNLGHWMSPDLASDLVRSIVGSKGVDRVEALSVTN